MESSIHIAELDGIKFLFRSYTPQNYYGVAFFFHGLGDEGRTFYPQMEMLIAKGYRCVYFDFPGCGENAGLSVNSDQVFKILENIVESNIYSNTLLVGHSLGGLYALRVFMCIQSKYKVTVCVSEATLLDVDLIFFNSVDISGSNPAQNLADGLTTESVPKSYLERYRNSLSTMSTKMFVTYVKDVQTNLHQYRSDIMLTESPFVYCFGLDSPAQQQRLSLGKHTRIKLKPFSDSGHWLHIEAPQAFGNTLCEIIDIQ